MPISPNVLSQTVAGEVVLLELESERYYTLSGVGARVWEMSAEDVDVETIIERLLDEYDVTESELRQDVTDFLNDLAAVGLIVP